MKAIKLFLLFNIFFVASSFLSSCSMFYSFGEEVDGFESGYNTKSEISFLASMEWHDGDSLSICCPNSINGYPVTELGGYIGRGYPCAFRIDIISYSSIYSSFDSSKDDYPFIYTYPKYEEEGFFESAPVSVIQFHVTLPDHLKELVYVDCDYLLYTIDEDNKIKEIIKPTYYLTISEDNDYFYTENGKLYNKKTKELITEFLYE